MNNESNNKFYVRVNGKDYDARVDGTNIDFQWDNRSSKTITMTGTYEQAKELFADGAEWSIVEKYTETTTDYQMNTTTTEKERVWENYDYSLSGEIVDHRDGTVSIKMGKMTELEEAYVMLIGG